MTSYRQGLDALRAIVLEDVPGCASVVKFGRNTDVDAASAPEDVWNGGGLYTGMPTITVAQAETVTVVSASANDTAAGTGLRTIRLEGLGSAGEAQTENLTMNGTNAVTSTKTWYRVFRAYGLTGGSGQTNAGAITVRHSSTTANIFIVMPVGAAQSHVAAYTIPAGQVGLITRAHLSAANGQQTAQEATVVLAARGYQTSIWRHFNTQHVPTTAPVELRSDGGRLVPALADLVIRVTTATSDNLDISAAFEVFLFPA